VLSLAALSAEAVASYLAARFPQHQFPTALAAWLHQRTDGHPLFLATLVQALVERGVLCTTAGGWTMPVGLDALNGDMPERLRQLLRQQILRLPPESQRMLEVASVAGVEFVAAAVAVGLEADADAVEERCEALVAQELLCPLGVMTWPNGVVATRYAFRHVLYQQVVYQGLGAGRRVRLHQRLGGYLEAAYGTQAGESAAELAEHFVRGQDPERAVSYLRQAAENAAQRYAHREVIDLLTRALALLKQLPETSERIHQELEIQLALGPVLMAIKGHAAPEVEHAYTRARVLCQQVENTPQYFRVLRGLWAFSLARGVLQSALEWGEQLLTLAQRGQDPTFLLQAHLALGLPLFHLGECSPARVHLEQGMTFYDIQLHRSLAFRAGQDPGVTSLACVSWALWVLGYPDQAQQRSQEALTLAEELAHSASLAYALHFAGVVHQLRREEHAAHTRAEAVMMLATEQGFAQRVAQGTILRGWALTAQSQEAEGLGQMRQGLAAYQATGAKVGRPHMLALLAEAYTKGRQVDEGLCVLAEALATVHTTGERYYEAELYRLHGELLLARSPACPTAAETCFQQALTIARRQQAKSWELRAATSLARLSQQQGKHTAAQQLLAEVYSWFTEGFDTADLQEARTLLEDLETAPTRTCWGGDT
jgi:predicted ATPase